jgi:hypothetical protein
MISGAENMDHFCDLEEPLTIYDQLSATCILHQHFFFFFFFFSCDSIFFSGTECFIIIVYIVQ